MAEPQVNEPADVKSAGSEIPANLKDIERLMVAAMRNKASDLHIKPGQKPILRVNTALYELGNRPLTPDDAKRYIYDIMTDEQRARVESESDLDFAYSLPGVGRFRINVFWDRGSVAFAARRVNTVIPSLSDLHLPDSLQAISGYNQGLVIVAGPTGCG